MKVLPPLSVVYHKSFDWRETRAALLKPPRASSHIYHGLTSVLFHLPVTKSKGEANEMKTTTLVLLFVQSE